jgi:hypothetical protein
MLVALGGELTGFEEERSQVEWEGQVGKRTTTLVREVLRYIFCGYDLSNFGVVMPCPQVTAM